MKLPVSSAGYSKMNEQQARGQIEQALAMTHKRNQDVDVSGARLLLQDENGDVYSVEVSGGGLVLVDSEGNVLSTDAKIRHAEASILREYGDSVSVSATARGLLKFGRYDSLGTAEETVWEVGGDETYATTNAIDTVSSSSAADTTVMTVIGHAVSGTGASAAFTRVTQTVTLNGQNKVLLATPLARTSRAYVSSGSLAGDFYVYEDDTLSGGVPVTAAKIHNTVQGISGQTQSFKAADVTADDEYLILTGGYVSVQKKTSAFVDFVMEHRQPGGVFRPVGGRVSLGSASLPTVQVNFDPYMTVPPNSDIRIRAIGSTTGVSVDASFQGYFASVV